MNALLNTVATNANIAIKALEGRRDWLVGEQALHAQHHEDDWVESMQQQIDQVDSQIAEAKKALADLGL